jgi:hypothetical protein
VYELAGADGCMSLPFPLLVGRKTTILLCCHHGYGPSAGGPEDYFALLPSRDMARPKIQANAGFSSLSEGKGRPSSKPARAVLNPRPSASLLVRFPRRCSLPHPIPLLPPKPSLPPPPSHNCKQRRQANPHQTSAADGAPSPAATSPSPPPRAPPPPPLHRRRPRPLPHAPPLAALHRRRPSVPIRAQVRPRVAFLLPPSLELAG